MLFNKILEKTMTICVLEIFSKFVVKIVLICSKSYRLYHTIYIISYAVVQYFLIAVWTQSVYRNFKKLENFFLIISQSQVLNWEEDLLSKSSTLARSNSRRSHSWKILNNGPLSINRTFITLLKNQQEWILLAFSNWWHLWKRLWFSVHILSIR